MLPMSTAAAARVGVARRAEVNDEKQDQPIASAVGMTALGMAKIRAAYSGRSDGLFDDRPSRPTS